jgi:hypothetical protein
MQRNQSTPPRLRELGAVCLRLDPARGCADLSCGDRSYHFGYAVAVAEDLPPDQYRMTCYGERVDDRVELGMLTRALPGGPVALHSGPEVRPHF